jgi:hypothetical protein
MKKGVSFLGTYTLEETVSHLNILEKAISERKEKERNKKLSDGHQIVNRKMDSGDLLKKAFSSPNFVSMNL